ncbi:hypothetical protein FGO68_gene15121 [Halteria grandinella]|uniref:SH3 domain-containing protein n=1 Tax=Halteria grandinella TaxID=5974 RepID=A0A8J8NBM2_HALGN|nr:hypothetical protein FGO68_gene15121 [Halteria grandinella]
MIFQSCIAQQKSSQEKLYGTWEETHRDYVYFKSNMKYEFTKDEANLYTGTKIVFTKDTLYAYVTYLTENLIAPVLYEEQLLKTDTLDWEGNLDELFRIKGAYCTQYTLKVPKYNGYKHYFDYYDFYLFSDGSLAQIEDYSLHYYKKISNKGTASWPVNEFGQTVIKGYTYGSITIDKLYNNKKIIITQIPAARGENYMTIYKNVRNNYKEPFKPIFEISEKSTPETRVFVYDIDSTWIKITISIGDNFNINDAWEIRYKFVDKVGKISTLKSFIYSTPNNPTKMYLLKGDEVEILEEKDQWLRIRYYGKQTIEGWIKKSEVE